MLLLQQYTHYIRLLLLCFHFTVTSPCVCTMNALLGCSSHTPINAASRAGALGPRVDLLLHLNLQLVNIYDRVRVRVRVRVWQLLDVCNRNVMRSFTRRWIGHRVILRKLFHNTATALAVFLLWCWCCRMDSLLPAYVFRCLVLILNFLSNFHFIGVWLFPNVSLMNCCWLLFICKWEMKSDSRFFQTTKFVTQYLYSYLI